MDKPLIVYVAGPYRRANGRSVRQHIRSAERVAVEVWKRGHYALCPHLNAAFFEGDAGDDLFLTGGLEMLRRCDAVVLCPWHHESSGTREEVRLARELGLPVYTDFHCLPRLR
jgi:hypothetical protein